MFEQRGSGSGFNSLADDAADSQGTTKVKTVSFDDVVASSGPVDFIKMDCEGGEYDLVYSSKPESWETVERLVLEYHAIPGQSWEELRGRFAELGLHVVRVVEGTPGLGLAWLSRRPLDDPKGHPDNGPIRQVGHDLKRVAQTPGTFRNWPQLLGSMVRERVGQGSDTLTFRTRSGLELTTPNAAGARLPAYEQFAEDNYRLEWFLGPLLDRPIHAVDGGAHVGTFACRLAELHPRATITCFEPSEQTARYLADNITRNGFGDRVTIERAALTGHRGWASFDDEGGASVMSRLVDNRASTVGSVTQVPTVGFDDVVAQSPSPIDFVKLDCEGGEYELTRRSSPESWSTVQRVVLEYHEVPGESWAELRAWFAGIGLHLVREESTRTNLGLAWLARGPA
jgi:FkbM family methyltransferase